MLLSIKSPEDSCAPHRPAINLVGNGDKDDSERYARTRTSERRKSQASIHSEIIDDDAGSTPRPPKKKPSARSPQQRSLTSLSTAFLPDYFEDTRFSGKQVTCGKFKGFKKPESELKRERQKLEEFERSARLRAASIERDIQLQKEIISKKPKLKFGIYKDRIEDERKKLSDKLLFQSASDIFVNPRISMQFKKDKELKPMVFGKIKEERPVYFSPERRITRSAYLSALKVNKFS
jgi:hypothetical protein